MKLGKFASLRSQIVQSLHGLRYTLSAFFVSVWGWFSAKISSGKTVLASYYKSIRERTEPTKNKEEQYQEGQNRETAGLPLQETNHPGGAEEREHRNHEHGHSARQQKPALVVRILRGLWRPRRTYISAKTIEILFAAAVAFAAWTQAMIYWKQSVTLQSTLDETRQSVNLGRGQLQAATQALKSSQETFQIDQRPYLVVDNNFPQFFQHPPMANQNVQVNAQMKNLGKTPAVRVLIALKLFKLRTKLIASVTPIQRKKATEEYIRTLEGNFSELRTKTVHAREALAELEKRNLSPGQDVAPSNVLIISTQEDILLSDDEYRLLVTDGEISLDVIGVVTYTDVHNNQIYTTEFCSFYFGPPQTSLWHFCDSHNFYR